MVSGQGEDNRMRIDSKALVASISSLADAQPQHDLAATLQQVWTPPSCCLVLRVPG